MQRQFEIKTPSGILSFECATTLDAITLSQKAKAFAIKEIYPWANSKVQMIIGSETQWQNFDEFSTEYFAYLNEM